MLCKECGSNVGKNKKWGFANICEYCDDKERVNKSMGIMIADGKTDYHVQIVRNPSSQDVEMIQRIGRAWDPRSQLTSINKVSN